VEESEGRYAVEVAGKAHEALATPPQENAPEGPLNGRAGGGSASASGGANGL